MSDNGQILMDACNLIINDPSLQPEYDKVTGCLTKTHCNQACLLVARTMGCLEFNTPVNKDPLRADEMISLMLANASGKWRTGTGSEATIHALSGGLAIAAMSSKVLKAAHGHVAIVAPIGMQNSGSLKKDVPLVANIGKTVGIMKSSGAFPVSVGEAQYFLYAV